LSAKPRRFRITGRVQGVHFRHHTRLEADRLDLIGYAANMPDGSVEVVVAGAEAAVEALRAWLHRGPRAARVEAVTELEAGEHELPPARFEVR